MLRATAALSLVCIAALVFGLAGTARAESAAEGVPTFAKDVAPILYENCVSCHRPNHMAPMSLISYEDARPWARAVKTKVVAREMPPWDAAPGIQEYTNDSRLTQDQVDTISAWVDGGSPRGNDADLPPVPQFTEGWSIGEPDYVFTMVEPFDIPADGTVPYRYFNVPTNLTEDIWISANQFKPGDRRVVHHVISQVVEGTGTQSDPGPMESRDRARTRVPGARVGGFVPNSTGNVFREGTASRIPAGAEIEAELHYTAIGVPVRDQSSWGVVLATAPPSDLRETGGGIVSGGFGFVIPPHDPDFALTGTQKFNKDSYLVNMMPHMHVRGKSATYTVVHPDGTRIVALDVPEYDFNWQLTYDLAEPIFMPKGSQLEVELHFDNSGSNRYNPDPDAAVTWGEQTWEEMALGFYSTVAAEQLDTTQGQQ